MDKGLLFIQVIKADDEEKNRYTSGTVNKRMSAGRYDTHAGYRRGGRRGLMGGMNLEAALCDL